METISYHINTSYDWQNMNLPQGCFFYAGHRPLKEQIFNLVNSEVEENPISENLFAFLKKSDDYSGGILQKDGYVFAWADHIKSYPVYYAFKEDILYIGNDARDIALGAKLNEIDETSLAEFSLAGYISGRETLYKGLYALLPGQMLCFEIDEKKLSFKRFHEYKPEPEKNDKTIDDYADELNRILDRIVKKIIERHKGQELAFPLSAGLDSRILLAKFHEHGAKNLTSFSYGPRFNFEAKHAKKVAEILDVPWRFIGLSQKKCRAYFESSDRLEYWEFADSLKAAPSMREFSALKYLKDHRVVCDDAVMINGQSGDFISGGHIAKNWHRENDESRKKAPQDEFLKVLKDKHYDLWPDLKRSEHMSSIEKKIVNTLSLDGSTRSLDDWAALEEHWEYEARQLCLVVNGQRSYDFFGYQWEMPLWEKELVDFFEVVPFEYKYNQTLYKYYLKKYDYKNLFSAEEKYIWRWPAPMLWVVPAARVIGLIAGSDAKKNFYSRMKYFGHYANQYGFFPLSLHLKSAHAARNIFSLYVRQWFLENGVCLPDDIRKAMFIDE